MDRRNFLKTGTKAGAGALLFSNLPSTSFSRTRKKPDDGFSYKPGDQISPDVFVVDENLKRHQLLNLIENNTNASVHLLYIFGGGAMGRENKLGGIWCQDSFEDLQVLRYVQQKYEFSPLNIIPVACSPIYSTQLYGLTEGVLLNEPDDSEKYQEAVRKFIASTKESVAEGFISVTPYFDVRFRLLFNRKEEFAPGDGYGEIYDWQGKFRADDEDQKYGVPTIWLLDYEGKVLQAPFHGNVYHSEPYSINYTLMDVDKALQLHLE